MTSRVKPHIVVSQCLEFSACRYDGQMLKEDFIKRLKEFVIFQPVCPEVAIGLATPRDPIKIVERNKEQLLLQPSTGKDLTTSMKKFADSYLGKLKDIDGFILKSKSPSCGIKDVKVFPKIEPSAILRRDSGIFAQEVLHQFPDIAIETEARLTNLKIREHFLIRIFLLAAWRKVLNSNDINQLLNFHRDYKLLFMAYHQEKMRQLGKIVASYKKNNIEMILSQYSAILKSMFVHPARHKSHVNVLQHAFGYFKQDLAKKEKQFFLDQLDKFMKEKISLSHVLVLLRSYIIRFENQYLSTQKYFLPFPESLLNSLDSGQ